MVFCTSLGKLDKCNQDFLLMTILVATMCEDVSAESITACSVVLATSLPPSKIVWKWAPSFWGSLSVN